jgi:hypothetical protein
MSRDASFRYGLKWGLFLFAALLLILLFAGEFSSSKFIYVDF